VREARRRLIELIEADDWEITETAASDGFAILRRDGERPPRWGVVGYVLNLLRADFPMHPVELGGPPRSQGIGDVRNNCDGEGLYVKVTIKDDRLAWVVSFHTSKHHKG